MLGYKKVFGSRALGSLFVIVLLQAIVSLAMTSYLSLWAVQQLGVSEGQVSWIFLLTGLSGMFLNPLVGAISDRLHAYRGAACLMQILALITCIGLYFVKTVIVAVPFLILLGIGIIGQILALAGMHMKKLGYTPEETAQAVAVIRQAWPIGCTIAPMSASAVLTLTDEVRQVFLIGIVAAGMSLAIFFLFRKEYTYDTADAARKKRGGIKAYLQGGQIGQTLRFLALFIAFVLIWQPTQVRTTYVSLLVTGVLGLPKSYAGMLITVFSTAMIFFLPVAAKYTVRIGAFRSMCLSAVFGALYCVLQCMQALDAFVIQCLLQVLLAVGAAIWNAATLQCMEELFPNGLGLADGLFAAVRQAPPLAVGILVGPWVELFGVRAAFLASAACEVAGIVLIVLFGKKSGRESENDRLLSAEKQC